MRFTGTVAVRRTRAVTLNGTWALDFMHDALYGGRSFRTLNVLDEANREALAGPEFTAEVFTAWCAAQQIELRYIQPGKPDQNAFIERFNRTYREEVLDAYVFASVSEVQALTDEWLPTYNERRPHESLGSIPPTRFLPRPRCLLCEIPTRS